MQPSSITYKGEIYYRQVNSKYRCARLYYKKYRKGKPTITLHRKIWEDNFGKIPLGYIIHHKDGNTFNNRKINLQCMSVSEHAKIHSNTLERKQQLRETQKLKKRLIAARAWHKTEEGKAWHKKYAKNLLFGEEKVRICLQCSNEYKTCLTRETRFCCIKCRTRYNSKMYYLRHYSKSKI